MLPDRLNYCRPPTRARNRRYTSPKAMPLFALLRFPRQLNQFGGDSESASCDLTNSTFCRNVFTTASVSFWRPPVNRCADARIQRSSGFSFTSEAGRKRGWVSNSKSPISMAIPAETTSFDPVPTSTAQLALVANENLLVEPGLVFRRAAHRQLLSSNG